MTLPATSILATGEDAHTLHFTYKGKSTRVEQVSKSADGAQIVGAIRRYGRKGGRVAVLGSWEVFADKALADTRYANRELLKRLITWLLEANNDTAQT